MGQVQVQVPVNTVTVTAATRDGPGDVWTGLAQCDAL